MASPFSEFNRYISERIRYVKSISSARYNLLRTVDLVNLTFRNSGIHLARLPIRSANSHIVSLLDQRVLANTGDKSVCRIVD